MPIKSTVMVNAGSNAEYAVVTIDKKGIADFHHLSKDYYGISDKVKTLVSARTNSMTNGLHYFIDPNIGKIPAEYQDIGIVEVMPTDPKGYTKWPDTTSWVEALTDITMATRSSTGLLGRKVGSLTRWPSPTVNTLVRFVKDAFPNDYDRWTLADPAMQITKRNFDTPNG